MAPRSSTPPPPKNTQAAKGPAARATAVIGEVKPDSQKTPVISSLALVVFLGVLVFVLARHWEVPAIVHANTPLSEGFSAERARDVSLDLSACGIRYIGSHSLEVCAVNAIAKHIALASAGNESRVTVSHQSASGHYFLDFLGGLTIAYQNLTNVVARVKGRSSVGKGGKGKSKGCALLISSHFDSTFGSPAASDANAEIAIMVELLRLFSYDPPEVDVIFNFNGGEEFLMPAAHGFVTSHPWAPDICACVNLEAAGSGGRELLFQAGPRNRWIADVYRQQATRPYGSSITQVLFQTGIIPGDTDYRIYRDYGDVPGVDFAVLANGWVYHTWQDNLEHLDFRSVQRYGETVEPFARGLAKALKKGKPSGSESEEGAVFFDVAGTFFIMYPAPFAQNLHVALSVLAISLAVWQSQLAVKTAMKLVASALCGTLSAALVGLIVAFTPASMAACGTPQLVPLLYLPPTILSFLAVFRRLAGDVSEREAAAGSITLAATICLALSVSKVGVLASYLFLLWSLTPLVGEILSVLIPGLSGAFLAVASFLLPWLIQLQFLVLALDLLCPLTFRSGTFIPGDAVPAVVLGLMASLCLAFSARFILHLRLKTASNILAIMFGIGVILALTTFPYSVDRPKRIFMQHVARSTASWDLSKSNFPEWLPTESGIWTVAMDWNNVESIGKHAPFGLPSGWSKHDDSQGLYGGMPQIFPLRKFVGGGAWAPGNSPELPRKSSVEPSVDLEKRLQIHFSGSPQMTMVLGPRSAIKGWSYGLWSAKGVGEEVRSWPGHGKLPEGLPPVRFDCDCYFVLLTTGGANAANGIIGTHNFTIDVEPGQELLLELATHHIEANSSDLIEQRSKSPSWENLVGWVSEYQMHRIRL
eukprot:TRINITY_DN90655_c0_g1_i1.p1 TRINITY_DN90655_c0_g1~~TRINITY_DN90655_c0_g1_i1.p1  ORF type:complete len:874 (+),score=99.41 TRINITY_DN90655_c0_g1_i1:29-2650(+)